MGNTYYTVEIDVAGRASTVLIRKRIGETQTGMLARAMSIYAARLDSPKQAHIKGCRIVGIEFSDDRLIDD